MFVLLYCPLTHLTKIANSTKFRGRAERYRVATLKKKKKSVDRKESQLLHRQYDLDCENAQGISRAFNLRQGPEWKKQERDDRDAGKGVRLQKSLNIMLKSLNCIMGGNEEPFSYFSQENDIIRYIFLKIHSLLIVFKGKYTVVVQERNKKNLAKKNGNED